MHNILIPKKHFYHFYKDVHDYEHFDCILREAYENIVETQNGIPSFNSIWENSWVETEIKMPITSYESFGNPIHWDEMTPEESNYFVDVYEGIYSEIEHDIITVLNHHRLFLNIYNDHIINNPLSQVW